MDHAAWIIDWPALGYFLAGGVVGFIVAERRNIVRFERHLMADYQQHHTSEKIRQWSLIIIVLVVAVSSYLSIYYAGVAREKLNDVENAQHALDEDQEDFERQTDCQQELIAKTIDALKARSAFAEQQARVALARDTAALNGDEAQRAFLIALQNPRSDAAAETAHYLHVLDDLIEARQVSVQATKEQLKVRVDNPYPTLSKVESCK